MCRISVGEFTPRDFPESVYEMWNESFGDSRAEIGHILSVSSGIFTASIEDRAFAERSASSERIGEKLTDESKARTEEPNGANSRRAAGMLCTFDVSLNGARGAYIYAVCTRRRYRGMGVMRTLLSEVLGILQSRGISFAFLVPARREYFPMYEKLGFDVCAPGLSGTPGCGGARTAVGREEFSALRPTAFDGDFDRLYSLYLSSPQVSPMKGKELFRLSLEEYANGGICYTRSGGDGAEPDGYVIFEPNSKKSINILEIRRCYGAKRGIISSEEFAREANSGADAPFAHSRDLDIDGLAEMSLQANISARGIIDAGLAPQVNGANAPPCGCTAAPLTDSQKCPCEQAFFHRGEIDAGLAPQVNGEDAASDGVCPCGIFGDAAHADGDPDGFGEVRTPAQVARTAHDLLFRAKACKFASGEAFERAQCSADGGDVSAYNIGRIISPAEKQKALFACFGGFRPGEITVDMFMEL